MPGLGTRFLNFLRSRRRRLDEWLTNRGLAHTFSLMKYQLHVATMRLLHGKQGGTALDAGSGRCPYKPLLSSQGMKVLTLDVERRCEETDLIGDIQNMPVVASESIDLLLCTQVLEHVPRPWEAVREFARVLKPGGEVVLSVPHLSLIHEAPHDYYRYTQYGLSSLFKAEGFEVVSVQPTGGLIAFLTHPISALWLGIIGAIPGLGILAWLVNCVGLLLAGLLDRVFGLRSLYPAHILLHARKPVSSATPLETKTPAVAHAHS